MRLSIPWFSKRRLGTGRVALAVGPDGLSVAVADRAGAVQYCRHFSDPGDIAELVAGLVRDQHWQQMPCSVVLHPVYYQLLLGEAPAVPDEEMLGAVRWKVKDLLDFPLDEAAVEYFRLPEDAYRGRQKMLYAAALRKSVLKSLVEPVEQAGLALDCIEVAELALHHLAVRAPAEDARGGIAYVQLYAGEGFINLVEDGQVYLCRRFDIGLEHLAAGARQQQNLEALLLQLQRSLDYYESQLGKGIITHLYYSPHLERTALVGDYLTAQLGLNVAGLSLPAMPSVDAQQLCATTLTALGAALGPLSAKEIAARAAD